MQNIVIRLAKLLAARSARVVTVESCTGGWIGKTLTDLSGSSDWFAGGLITYTNQSKVRLAGVPARLIEQNGAVSIPVAEAMAAGGLDQFENCISVAVSGIAGPGGGSVEKPVGTVCIATCYENLINSRSFLFSGDREQVRLDTVKQALLMLIDTLETTEK